MTKGRTSDRIDEMVASSAEAGRHARPQAALPPRQGEVVGTLNTGIAP